MFNLYAINLALTLPGGGGGWYSLVFLVGVCGLVLQTLALIQTKKCNFQEPLIFHTRAENSNLISEWFLESRPDSLNPLILIFTFLDQNG